MIDVENIVFNTVSKALRAKFPEIFVSGENVAAISTFPAATLTEMDNSIYFPTIDNSGVENHATVMYQAEAYSSLVTRRKSQCKAIMAEIDKQMWKMGFTRMGTNPINMTDTTKYRMVSRYRGIVSKDNYVYKR